MKESEYTSMDKIALFSGKIETILTFIKKN